MVHHITDSLLFSFKQNSRGKVVASETGDASVDCERLEEEAKEAQELLQQCRKRRREIAEEIKSLKKTIKSLEVKLPKLEMEINGCDTTREELTKLIPELREQCHFTDEDIAKKAELVEKIDNCRSEMASCATLASKLEKEVDKLQKKIMDAGGPRMKKQKEICEKTLAGLNDAEKALRSAKVDVGSAEKAAKKAESTKESLEGDLEQCVSTLEENEAEFKELETGALQVMQAYEEVKVVEAEKRAALDMVSKESEELRKIQSDIKGIEIDLLGQLEAYEKQISEFNKKKQHWEKEIAKIEAIEAECDFDLDEDEEETSDNESESDNHDQSSQAEQDDSSSDTEMKDVEEEEDAAPKEPNDSRKRSALTRYSFSALEKYSVEEVKDTIQLLETERNTLAKNANMGAIEEYRKKEADYLAR